MTPDISQLTIASARKHLDAGDFSAVDLAKAYLEAIAGNNPKLNAYLEVFSDVIEQAQKADEIIKRGEQKSLTGIPIAVKDNILIKGRNASAASKILKRYVAPYDSTVAGKLLAAGSILLGRTNMDEFAMGASTENSAFGPSHNPRDTTRVPGGSSGGSAAAVAGDIALAALGSDTAGSIRQPAALCGIVGFKPTYGSVSRHGLIALGSSLDVIGPMTKTVRDAEIVFEVIKGKDTFDSTSVDENDHPSARSGVKMIGVPRAFLDESGMKDDVRAEFDKSLEQLSQLGYEIVDIDLPHVHYAVPAYYVLLPAEASSNLARFDGMRFGLHESGDDLLGNYLKSRGRGFGPEPRRRIIIGTYVLSSGYYDAYYNRANAVRGLIAQDYAEAFKKVDVIATPTAGGPAFKIGEKDKDPVQMYLEDVFTVPANHTGLPAISVPAGSVSRDGVDLPLGLHFVAPHMNESLLFEVGKKFLGETE